MRLQSLEIKGFKSFADKTVIHFTEDVIGIVGPNGCGKSNIIDAIRWVLGEQKSKELRSDKMESVIFNGTKTRKQSGVAEVSLTFENTKNILPTEYTMVTITRLLYRTGESEYRLNGVNCRLKDITTLFMDTGIGSNSYAIIALGMVDDLLADRENSRRRLFEQAAGISKYKLRKHETLNKLKGTEEDLNRVEDLLFEIEGQVKILEKQAKRAQKYIEMKSEYRTLSLELAVFRLDAFKEKYKTLQQKIQIEGTQLAEVEAKLATLEAQIAHDKATIIDKEQTLAERQKELNSLVGRIRGAENDRKVIEQRIDFLQQNIESTGQQSSQAAARLASLIEDIDYYRGEINGEKRIEASFETALDNAEQHLKSIKLSNTAAQDEFSAFTAEKQKIVTKNVDLEKNKAVNQANIEALERDLERVKADLLRREEEANEVNIERNQLSDNIQVKQETISQLEQEEEKRKEKLAQAEQKLTDLQQKLTALQRENDSKKNEYKLIKSLVDNLEGFPDSIRFLSQDKEWAASAPLLSDILYTQPDFRIPIENYLEPYLNYYVVPNLATAVAAIQRLKTAQKGKANFFLLDKIQDLNPNEISHYAAAIPAIEVVKTDDMYLPLKNHLLQNVYILENDLPNDLPNGLILLRKEGDLLRSSFRLSGGSVGAFEGKRIGRKKNLELLEQEINVLDTQIKEFQDLIKTEQSLIQQLKGANYEPQIRREKDDINRLSQKMASLAARLESFETAKNEAVQRTEQLITRRDNLAAEYNSLMTEQASILIEINHFTQKIEETEANVARIVAEMNTASQLFNEKNIEFIKQQNKIQALQRELSFREKQLSDLKLQQEQTEKQQHTGQQDLEQARKEVDDLIQNLQKMYQNRRDAERVLNDAEQIYYKSRSHITETEEIIRTENRRRNDGQNLLNSYKEEFSEVKLSLTSIGERLRVEFEVEVNDLINQSPNPAFEKDSLTEKVDTLKRKLDTYGEVNPMAIEAFTEMTERYNFIIAQRNDLADAKNSLLETIAEIETTATNRFMEAFEKVRENFIIVFRSLFTADDSCDLLLAEPNNPLECRIDITAKPKGKRPQSINQLSGGEKTLTATALLFSLYLLKPAPFCIFDEVDAPLDDVKVEKFNNIIKEFSKDSQFIIVTHNKGTMAAVDVVYGVSMIEQGVSRVLPVDFRSLK